MSTENQDFWPTDIAKVGIVAPATILNEQASLLGKKTRGLVTAVVRTSSDERWISHTLVLQVPALANYTYALLLVRQPVLIYPLRMQAFNKFYEIPTQEEFIAVLRAILSSDDTKRIIHALLAQVLPPSTSKDDDVPL